MAHVYGLLLLNFTGTLIFVNAHSALVQIEGHEYNRDIYSKQVGMVLSNKKL